MRRPELIARQAAHPRGVLGRVIARIMALETATPNQRTLELLCIDEGCRVLEVGFGHGHTLARAAELAPKVFVAGIDISRTMVEMAQAFNRDSIAKGLIEVRQASSDQIPYPDESFDRIYAVHTLYFWHDPLAHLREIRRVCREGGRFVLAFGAKEDARAVAAFPESVYTFYSVDESRALLSMAGFFNVMMSLANESHCDKSFLPLGIAEPTARNGRASELAIKRNQICAPFFFDSAVRV